MEDGHVGQAEFRAVTQRRRRGPAAVTLAAIAFVGFAFLTKELTTSAPVAIATPPPSPVAIATATAIGPSAAPVAVSDSGPPARDPAARPYAMFVAVSVHAGKTHLIPTGPTPVQLTVNLPGGWEGAGPSMYLKRDPSGPVGLSIGAYEIRHVNTYPCRWASDSFTNTAYPPTAAGLALALSAFWGQDPNQVPFFSNSTIAPIASRPIRKTIGGYPAWYLEVLIPSVLDLSQCDGGQLVLWESADGSARYGLGPGEIDRLWVVDVQGVLVVIDATLPLLASPSDTAELQKVIDSVRIGP